MCGRFVILSKNPFGLEYTPSYNVTPSQLVPIKTIHRVKLTKWSYSPMWRKDMNLINCRSETMKEKPSFKDAKRCVIYHDGWYEWQRKGKEKIPFYHSSKSKNFAGLYNEIGFLILTRNSANKINHIHHRQPVLLNDNEISSYLEGEDILNSSANNEVEFHQVSKDVNNPQNNNPKLINAVDL